MEGDLHSLAHILLLLVNVFIGSFAFLFFFFAFTRTLFLFGECMNYGFSPYGDESDEKNAHEQ